MPELPEVEITRRGLLPLINQSVKNVVIRNASMRWPIPSHLPETLNNQTLISLNRRAKYILAEFSDDNKAPSGTLLLHLGGRCRAGASRLTARPAHTSPPSTLNRSAKRA